MPAGVSALVRWLARPAIAVVAAGFAVAAVAAVERSVPGLTSYAGTSAAAHTADLVAGLSLLALGVVACFESTARRVGVLAVLLGVAWFAPDFEGWNHGPVVARSLGAVVAPLIPALVLHVASVAPSGRLRSRLALVGVTGAYAVAVATMVGRALFRDPFLETTCWRSCVENALLVHADPAVANAFDEMMLYSALVLGVAAAAVAATRLLRAGGAGRRSLAPVLAPAFLASAAGAAYAVLLIRMPLEDPARADFASIFFIRAISFVALAGGVAVLVVRAHRIRGALRRLVTELRQAPLPGKLEEALRAAVRDPTLLVAYRVGSGERYVDSCGEPVDATGSGAGRAVTPVTRAGRPIALVLHDPAVVDPRAFAEQIGAAARLAIDNERLRAELLAQLEELRASRVRVVEAGDAVRRRLERDLHDGAQQRLLALSYDLRTAAAAAASAGDDEVAGTLATAVEQARTALVELRDVAHGIFPAILTEAGLGAALASLADEAPLPVVLGEVSAARHAPAVETAAYVCVADAVADAAARNASYVAVDVYMDNGSLVVSVTDDGAPRAARLVHLVDRVGALMGEIDSGPTTLRARIPCA